ncbi:HlyC/CorC family transporter [Pararhodospirillum photometricum]|uniref:Mg2+ and Co2+ transporter CorB n=1 Tax=Pararhodospirillum photometricum DSM 122 TaxID=1150469 RepID=H6SJ37_PARPM|nr:HlyC/CorC family transporter [Pararhodospirillum photometricum]CCG08002.1 Mg2+ and Co2+ transporter CorB [Pararhodospirillum photometricum DSM 122]
MTVTLIVVLILIVLSALFSSSETALTAASRPLMHELERDGDGRASVVNRLLRSRERLIGTILIGNTAVNILASSLATSLAITLFDEAGVAYATVTMTVVLLIFGEILPKTYALIHTNPLALRVAPIMAVLTWLLFPVTTVFQGVVKGLLHLLRVRRPQDAGGALALSELRGAIELHTADSPDKAVRDERAMLHSILDLTDVPVSDIMIHRSNVMSIDVEQSTPDIVTLVLESPFSRIPLWRERQDNIVGLLHTKDLLRAVQGHRGPLESLNVERLAAPPWFVPDTTTLWSQLQAFRQRREHFALVVDEYGSLLGIVTLEDILEEIVGDITDEHDIVLAGVRPQPDGSFLINGEVTLRDLNREFDWALPDEEAATLAGLVLRESRSLPRVGEIFQFHGFRFEVTKRVGNRLSQLRVTPLTPS